ncbi:KTSC domain-containing protein [bacterium]|nr:MAG: KTSC domain-containing protein [bacterium]
MERTPVQSSSVSSVGYDRDSSTIEIEFLNGSVYQYFGVPESIFNGLMNAPSKGIFLDQFVKKAGYSYARIA